LDGIENCPLVPNSNGKKLVVGVVCLEKEGNKDYLIKKNKMQKHNNQDRKVKLF
jgi:hypothetical protein